MQSKRNGWKNGARDSSEKWEENQERASLCVKEESAWKEERIRQWQD